MLCILLSMGLGYVLYIRRLMKKSNATSKELDNANKEFALQTKRMEDLQALWNRDRYGE